MGSVIMVGENRHYWRFSDVAFLRVPTCVFIRVFEVEDRTWYLVSRRCVKNSY